MDLIRISNLFEGWSWFKFNNLELALGTNSKCFTSVTNVLKLKVRKFWGLIRTFLEVTGEKLVGGKKPPPILNRVNNILSGNTINHALFQSRLNSQLFGLHVFRK